MRIIAAVALASLLALMGSCSRDLPTQPVPQTIIIYDSPDTIMTVRVVAKPTQTCPSTEITFEVPVSQKVLLTLDNVTGYRIRTLIDDTLAAGIHIIGVVTTNEDGQPLKSGLYSYHLVSGGHDVRKFFGLCTGVEECEKMHE